MRVRMLGVVAPLAAACALVVGGCGGDDDSTSSSAQQPTQTSQQQGSTSEGASTDAQAILKKYTTRPTSIGITAPIDKPVPTGKKIAYIGCPAPQCVTFADEQTAAAKLWGWTVKSFTPTGPDASSTQAAVEQALAWKPDAITYQGGSSAVIQRQLQKAKDQGIGVFPSAVVADDEAPGIVGTTGSTTFDKNRTVALGQVIGASAPKASTIAVPAFQGFAASTITQINLKKGIADTCPTCKMDEIPIALTQIADAQKIIANAARSNPDVKWIFLTLDSLMGKGLGSALRGAGVTGVPYSGEAAIEDGVERVRNGEEAWVETYPAREMAWLNTDLIARHFAGVSLEPAETGGPQPWIITKDNVPAENSFPTVADYQAQFKKLWGKS